MMTTAPAGNGCAIKPLIVAAKMQSMAKPNQILVGDDVYTTFHPSIQCAFEKLVWKNNEWKYRRSSGELYPVYAYLD